jgi:hypothetical protein
MNQNGTKNVNVIIDEKLYDCFSEQISERGFTKYKAVEASLKAFMTLTPELQSQLISNPPDKAKEILIRGLVDAEIEEHLAELQIPKDKFLALLKQAVRPKSPKK